MIEANKISFFSLNYQITDNGRPVTEIERSAWSTKYQFTINNDRYLLRPEKLLSNRIVIEKNAIPIAKASPKFSVITTWSVEYNNTVFTLKNKNFFSSDYSVFLGEQENPIGNFNKHSAWQSSWAFDFPDKVDLWFQISVFCLCLISNLKKAAA